MSERSPRHRIPWAPFLAAWYLALTLLAELGDSVNARDAVGSLGYATITALLAWLASRVLVRDWSRRSLCAAIIVLWAGLFGTFRLMITARNPAFPFGDAGMLLGWTFAFALILVLIVRNRTPLDNVLRALTVALGLLIVVPTIGHARRLLQARAPRPTSVGTWTMARDSGKPDIYIILADMFGSPKVVQEQYQLDLQWFVDSLQGLGFMVPADARTNYVHTGLVLPTMLHSRLVHEELSASGSPVWEAATELIHSAPIWERLRAGGYRLVFFPTQYPPTAVLPSADLVLEPPDRPMQRLGQTWLFNTPVDLLLSAQCSGDCTWNDDFPHPIETSAAWQWKLDALATLPDSAGPVAAFIHFLGSHEPFVFQEDCAARDPWWPRAVNGPDSLLAKDAYADQLACAARLLLEAVSAIITQSEVSPIIVIQGDHGNGGIRTGSTHSGTVTIEEATRDQVNGRLRVFGAYRFPGADSLVYSTISPVNVLPIALRSVLGPSAPPQADRSFWSTWLAPLSLTELEWSGGSVMVPSSGSLNGHPSQSMSPR